MEIGERSLARAERTRRWLCVRSNVDDDAGLIDGHANLSLHEGSELSTASVTTYGLWPDDHPGIVGAGLANGSGSDIRTNYAGDDPASYAYVHCREITQRQYQELLDKLAEGETWGYTNNCSSFASETFYDVTGVDVDAGDWFGLETPRELGSNIIDMNGGAPSNYNGPSVPAPGPGGSSSSGS